MLTFDDDDNLWVVPRRAAIRYLRYRLACEERGEIPKETLAKFGGSLASDFVNVAKAIKNGTVEELIRKLEREFQR